MSTVVPFTPSTTSAFTFSPVIGGVQYNAIVNWSISGLRYYLALYDTSGTLVLNTAIVASGTKLGVTLSWSNDGVSGLASAVTNAPHNVPVGQLANVYISQTGTGFDGYWQALATGPETLTYALSNPDENQPVSGQLSFNVNLVATIGISGLLIFNYSDNTFEYA